MIHETLIREATAEALSKPFSTWLRERLEPVAAVDINTVDDDVLQHALREALHEEIDIPTLSPRPMGELSRRSFLKGTGALAAGAAVPAAASVAAAEEGDDPLSHKPESVSWEWDEGLLSRLQPMLDLSTINENSEDTEPNAMYGAVHYSANHDYAIAQYWTDYPYQKGWLPTGSDSHYGDHEPILVAFDPNTEEIQSVWYSAYHWLRGASRDLQTQDVNGNSHLLATVVSPWHQYSLGTTSPEAGELIDLKEFSTEMYLDWWDEGWDEHIHPKSVPNPYVMSWRSHWWQTGTAGISTDLIIVRVAKKIGWGGADNSDLDNLS